jgi:uncharacterized protein
MKHIFATISLLALIALPVAAQDAGTPPIPDQAQADAAATPTFEDAVADFEDQKYEDARRLAEPMAKAGDARAMAMMGALLQKGLGVTADAKAAADWFRQAAEKNHPGAAFSLAMMQLDGSLGKPNTDEAAKWLGIAAQGGNPDAQYNLGLVFAGRYGNDPDWEKAAAWFRKAGDQKMPEAEYNLGLLYLDGHGVAKDAVTAADWLSRAAVKGMVEAALEYGVLVMRGEGVQRDEKIGIKWLTYAAMRGHPVAQNRLARIYATGTGAQQDVIEAAKWNLLAAKGGRPDVTLDEMMAKLSPDQMKDAKQRAAAFVVVDPVLTKSN